MKSIILLVALVALATCQNPIPIPNLNISNFVGNWYMSWGFNTNYTSSSPTPFTCSIWRINPDFQVIEVTETIAGQNYTLALDFEPVNSGNSVWEINGFNWDWIAVDPIAFSWGVLASQQSQQAFVLSRNPSLSNLIVNAQILALQGEGYKVNATNQFNLPNTNC